MLLEEKKITTNQIMKMKKLIQKAKGWGNNSQKKSFKINEI